MIKKLHFILEKCLLERDDFYDGDNTWEKACEECDVDYTIVPRVPFARILEEAFPDRLPEICTFDRRYGIVKDTNEIFSAEYDDTMRILLDNGSRDFECKELRYIPVYHCTIQMADIIKDHNLRQEGLFYEGDTVFDCTQYYPKMDESIPMLNRDCMYISYGDLIKNWKQVFEYFGDWKGCLFIRPVSGAKTFVGGSFMRFTTPEGDYNCEERIPIAQEGNNFFKEETERYNKGEIDPRTLCLVAKSEPIKGEYRFVIIDGKVITGSQYRYNGALDKRIDFPQEAWELAERVAKQEYQPSKFYTCDVAWMYVDEKVELKDEDLKIDIYRPKVDGSFVVKTDRAVRIKHIPTGIIVQSEDERNQLLNKEVCLQKLDKILNPIECEFKVIELNSGSCSGLYSCDKNKIIEALKELYLQ